MTAFPRGDEMPFDDGVTATQLLASGGAVAADRIRRQLSVPLSPTTVARKRNTRADHKVHSMTQHQTSPLGTASASAPPPSPKAWHWEGPPAAAPSEHEG